MYQDNIYQGVRKSVFIDTYLAVGGDMGLLQSVVADVEVEQLLEV